MLINLTDPELSFQLEEKIKEVLSYDDKYRYRLGLGINHSTTEILKALVRLQPHKNSVAFVLDGDPILTKMLSYFVGEGKNVQTIHWKDLENPNTWVDNLEKDTIFVCFSEDHCFTGEIFPYVGLREAVESKRIYSIGLSHFNFIDNPLTEHNGFRSRVISLSPIRSISVLGSRTKKIEDLIIGNSPWTTGENKFLEKQIQLNSNSELINKFESKEVKELSFKLKNKNRTFDRSIIDCGKIDSFALMELICEKLNIAIFPPGEMDQLECTSLCRWGGIRQMQWLQDESNSDTHPQYLILSTNILEKVDTILVDCVEEILNLMEG